MRGKLWLAILVAAGCGGSSGDDDGDDDGGTVGDVTLPQALGGAFAASPDVYTSIPVHVVVDGDPDMVIVTVEGTTTIAEPGDGDWIADVSLAALADGTYTLEARAMAGDAESSATAELVITRGGRQLTSIGVDGNAGTPRLHAADGRVFVTWTDSRDGTRTARLAEIDGAGRFGEVVALLDRADDVLYARTAMGGDTVGVLFQEPGGPYENWFTVVDRDGAEVVAPIALEPEAMYGSYGGDVAWDGDAYVVTWRSNNGAGSSQVMWLRVTRGGDVTGPVVVAAPGNDDPHGGFDPITDISIAVAGETSVVSFTRYLWDDVLELEIPMCEVATVDAGGTVGPLEYARQGWLWHHDCRLLRDSSRTILTWGEEDLNSIEDNPPTTLRAAAVGADGGLDPEHGAGAVVVAAAEHRGEQTLAEGVLAWLDDRSYVDLTNGKIDLMVSPLAGDLTTQTPRAFRHARFIEGTSELRGAAAGTNRILTWVDERHGSGIADPKPELWLDTAWY